jgi:hypothetical protein
MTRYGYSSIAFLLSAVIGLAPPVLAQDEPEEQDPVQQAQEERLDGLFIRDEEPDQLNREEWLAGREARRKEFMEKHPEAAARLEQRRAEMEKRRAEFAEKYPEAAAEMDTWREEERTRREQHRAEMEKRREEFANKYPEAVAEMKTWREQERTRRNAIRQQRLPGREPGLRRERH